VVDIVGLEGSASEDLCDAAVTGAEASNECNERFQHKIAKLAVKVTMQPATERLAPDRLWHIGTCVI
jgi:hypothetical protein